LGSADESLVKIRLIKVRLIKVLTPFPFFHRIGSKIMGGGYMIVLICFLSLLIFFPLNGYAGPKEDYELQERCGKRAAEVFEKFYGSGQSSDKDGHMLSNYTCHHNKKLNKCFILIETKKYPSYKNDIEKFGIWTTKGLWDINENKQYGTYSRFFKIETSMTCEFSGNSCKSEYEWDALVKPYMEE
jgi:hypothetical protein